ncbi:MAG: GH3 auxin-responsive promoter family protein [Ruminiclostridium sp.]|nr:GH3 auxin-responsive promoter family protein [Ruminiclostridium sp.]
MEKSLIDETLSEVCMNAEAVNRSNLETIISENAQTEFGIKHGFPEIRNADDYRQRVPISEYSDYAEYIERMRKGDTGLLTAYPVIGYCMTSGTTGSAKYIPVTRTMLARYPRHVARIKDKPLRESGKKRIFINIFRIDTDKPAGSETVFSEITYRFFYEHGVLDLNSYAGGKDLLFVTKPCDIMYAKLWAALLTPDAVLIEALYMSELVRFFDYMEENALRVVGDIRKGKPDIAAGLPENIVKALVSMPVNEERLKEIERECAKGFENITRRLWKDCVRVAGVCGRAYAADLAALDKFCGDIPRYYWIYCASECIIGAPAEENGFNYVLMPDAAFFEFKPFPSDGTSKTLLPHELTVNEMYEPIITNYSGLYRYCLGDVVKITGYVGQSPLMEVMFRKGVALNIAGEKLTMRQVGKAAEYITKKGVTLWDYCIGAYNSSGHGRYIVAACAEGENADPGKLRELFDEALRSSNCDYDDLRRLGTLTAPEVYVMSKTSFEKFRLSQELVKKYGHNKPKHVFTGNITPEIKKEWSEYAQQ